MNDLINRQYAIKRFGEDGTWLERQGVTTLTMAEAKRRAVDILESFPSADRPIGKWVDSCTCSICHWIHEDNNGFALRTEYNYCPNCGAKMEV